MSEPVGKFLVSTHLLAELMHLPRTTTITGVYPGPNVHEFWVHVLDPDLPGGDFNNPPELTPSATKERVVWHWNLPTPATPTEDQ